MMLAHHRRKPPFELAEQIAEPAVAVTVRLGLPIFLPQHHQAHARAVELARQRSPIRLAASAQARLRAAPREQSLFENVVAGTGQAIPLACARRRLSWIVLRATPSVRPISRALDRRRLLHVQTLLVSARWRCRLTIM